MRISEYNAPVAENIKAIIEEKGLKQAIIAKRAGCSQQMLSDMLAGRKIIKVSDVVLLSSVLGVDANSLFRRREKETTKEKNNASLAINGDGSVELKADEIVINQESDKCCHQS